MHTKNDAKWWREEGPKRYEEFRSWLGNKDVISRKTVRDHIVEANHKSLLDVACGPAIDFESYEGKINYTGLDMTPEFLEKAPKGMTKVVGSIEKIPLKDNYADVVVARAILEHLNYYEIAIDECIRCATKEVVVVFYKKPGEEDVLTQMPEGFWDNIYSQKKFEKYVLTNSKVESVQWQSISDPVECDTICYIKLK